jgi:hypothetical protein
MMVRVEAGVNRSIEEYATPVWRVLSPNAARAGEQPFGDAAHQMIGAEHNTPTLSAILLQSR